MYRVDLYVNCKLRQRGFLVTKEDPNLAFCQRMAEEWQRRWDSAADDEERAILKQESGYSISYNPEYTHWWYFGPEKYQGKIVAIPDRE